jgi:uncharacterized RDD family membrane protein YckC
LLRSLNDARTGDETGNREEPGRLSDYANSWISVNRYLVMKTNVLLTLLIILTSIAPRSLGAAEMAALEKTDALVKRPGLVILGREVLIKENEIADNLVVINGIANIKGAVEHDVVLVGGKAIIDGKINGSMVVIGQAQLGPLAEIHGDSYVIGGGMTTDPGARVHGERVEISLGSFGALLDWSTDWITQGLLLMRPFPHRSVWAWGVAGVLLALYLALTLLFRRPIEAASTLLRAQGVKSFLIGLLAFILLGLLVVILVSSLIGILVVPFILCGFVAALALGKVVFYHAMGRQFGQQLNLAGLDNPLAAVLVGTGFFYLFYMVPVLGLIIWGVTMPVGLGALLLTATQNLLASRSNPVGSTGPGKTPSAFSAAPPQNLSAPAVSPLEPGNLLALPRAGFWIRTGATVIDFIIVGVLTTVLGMPHFSLVLWAIYHVALWTWQGTTLGGMVLGLKVIRWDGQALDFGLATARSVACVLSALPLMLGFMWVGWDPEKQSWHDRITCTQIVRTNRALAILGPVSSPLPAAAAPKSAPDLPA